MSISFRGCASHDALTLSRSPDPKSEETRRPVRRHLGPLWVKLGRIRTYLRTTALGCNPDARMEYALGPILTQHRHPIAPGFIRSLVFSKPGPGLNPRN